MDANTGRVLYEKGADVLTYPASITKVMTLMLLFDALESKKITYDTMLKVSKHASIQEPCKLGLKAGGKISVRDAIYGMITKSANDASVTIAEALAGSEEAFANLMTRRARALGMKHTTFKNASGLPHMEQRTTARDMAIMSQALLKKYPSYYGLFRIQSFSYKGVRHANHNKLLGKMDGVDGIKTGLTNASGFNLALSCERKGQRLIAVVMGGATGRSRDQLMTQLVEAAFNTSSPNSQPSMRYALASQEKNQGSSKNRIISSAYVTPSDSWMIQVGSYVTSHKAQEGAVRHLLTLGALYDISVKVSKAATKRRLKYRAYLDGFQEHEAREACALLKKQKVSCLVIPPHRSPKYYTAMN
jgi:D-alanyl-D-alanine carboxypeptidase